MLKVDSISVLTPARSDRLCSPRCDVVHSYHGLVHRDRAQRFMTDIIGGASPVSAF